MYYSKTGNTKKLAEAIASGVSGVEGVECNLKPVSDVTKDDFLSSDGIIAGSPVYFGTMTAELKHIFDKFVGLRQKMGDKIGAAFTTSGDDAGGKETTIMSIIQAMLIYGMIIVGDPLDVCDGAWQKGRQGRLVHGKRQVAEKEARDALWIAGAGFVFIGMRWRLFLLF